MFPKLDYVDGFCIECGEWVSKTWECGGCGNGVCEYHAEFDQEDDPPLCPECS